MRVTNISDGPRGFNSTSGTIFLEAGVTSDEIEMVEGELSSAKSTGYFEITGAPAKAADFPVDGYAVRTKSPGWFVVTKDGADVTKSLRKDDLAEFDEMSDEDKAAFVELNSSED